MIIQDSISFLLDFTYSVAGAYAQWKNLKLNQSSMRPR